MRFIIGWIEEIASALNRELLPPTYYALPEQHAAGFGPDVLTLPGQAEETDMGFYRRKQTTVTVRHVSGDRIVAVVEIISPGNKAGRRPLRSLVAKAGELLDR